MTALWERSDDGKSWQPWMHIHFTPADGNSHSSRTITRMPHSSGNSLCLGSVVVRMALEFDEATRRILDGKNFATVSTVNADGSPQASLVWFARDGDTLLFSTRNSRQKARNLARDPRVSVSTFDLDNPYDFVEIRGTAELVEDPEKTLPVRLSRKYLDKDPPPEPGVKRLIVRVIPERINRFVA
jgi:PPOX class probable F420-dependent enzyme